MRANYVHTKKMQFFFLFSLIFLSAFSLNSAYAVTPTVTQTPTPTPSIAAISQFGVDLAFDKEKVSEDNSVSLNITVKNTGNTDINNLVLRVPLLKTIQDTRSITESPLFNQLLNSGEYPSGFNDRGWIVNTLTPAATKNFSVKITTTDKTINSATLISKFKLPTTWSDPAGLESNKEQALNYFRVDTYLNGTYKQSYQKPFPQIDSNSKKITGLRLNEKYYPKDSKTTDFKNITDSNIKAYSPFILETTDVLIEWKEPIDFSSAGILEKMRKFDEHFKVEWGKVSIKSSELPFLLKSAQVTFKNIDLVNKPKIKIEEDTASLEDAKAIFEQAKKTVTINFADTLKSVQLSPDLIFDSTVIDTKEKRTIVKGKTSDPAQNISYQLDGEKETNIDYIDLSNGEFEVVIPDASKVKQVKVETALKNGEKIEKTLIVKYAGDNTASSSGSEVPGRVNAVFNPITLALLFTALGILCVIAGYVYYLYFRKKKNSELLSPELEKLSSDAIMTAPEINLNQDKVIDKNPPTLLQEE